MYMCYGSNSLPSLLAYKVVRVVHLASAWTQQSATEIKHFSVNSRKNWGYILLRRLWRCAYSDLVKLDQTDWIHSLSQRETQLTACKSVEASCRYDRSFLLLNRSSAQVTENG